MSRQERNVYIDIMKGIGIISVVIGHLVDTIPMFGHSFRILQFVYTYHMALFFFCAGYLFHEKYFAQPYEYIGKKVKSLYLPFVKYVALYALFANVFVALGLIQYGESGYLDSGAIFTMMINGIGFVSPGMFLVAFWFIPVLFFAMCAFCLVLSKFRHNLLAGAVMSVICGGLGLYFAERNYGFAFNLQTLFLMIPVIYVGFLVKRNWERLKKWVSSVAAVLIAILLYGIIVKTNESIDLSRAWIISPVLFYIVTFLGIYMILGISKWIAKSKVLTTVFSYIGKNSLHIMAMHVVGIKLVDLVAVTWFGYPRGNLATLIYSFDNLWPAYYIAGVGIPLALHAGYQWVVMKIKKILIAKKSAS